MGVRRPIAKLGLGLLLLLPLASCANSPWAQTLQNSLAADPRLGGAESATPSPSPSASPSAELPADFPAELPRYPNASLQAVLPASTPSPNPDATVTPSPVPAEVTTRWQTPDDRDRVLAFYQEQLQTNGWTLEPPSLVSAPGTLVATRSTPTPLTITVIVPPVAASPSPETPDITSSTTITIRYPAAASLSQASPTPTASPTPIASPTPPASPSPTADLEVFLGAEGTADGSAIASPRSNAPSAATGSCLT